MLTWMTGTMSKKLDTLLTGLAFPEGPRWHEGRLWFSDMHADEVVAMSPDGSRETIFAADTPVSGLGWLPDGRTLVVDMNNRRVLRIERDGGIAVHADLSDIATGHTNDMVTDWDGRAYVGNHGFAYPGGESRLATLACVEPDGSVHVAAEDLYFPNGSVITPDGRTLIVAETFGRRLTAFDIQGDGTLANRRLWAPINGGAVPDGICLDEEGAIWVASPTTNDVIRVAEGGEVLDRVFADQGVFACMLGGADRRTLYVLTARSSDREACRRTRSGRIEAVRVDVPGAGMP